jgi:hypothetical protein
VLRRPRASCADIMEPSHALPIRGIQGKQRIIRGEIPSQDFNECPGESQKQNKTINHTNVPA